MPRALRIGIVQNGHIVEERLLSPRAGLTIGSGPRNTIVFPGLPRRVRVFEATRSGVRLHFTSDREGRVAFGDTVIGLRAAVDAGVAEGEGFEHTLPLPPDARGRVVIDDVTVLFQFVDRPPAARATLPPSLRRQWRRRPDRGWLLSLSGSAVAQVLMALYLVSVDVPEPPKRILDPSGSWTEVHFDAPKPMPAPEQSPEVTVAESEAPAVPTTPEAPPPEAVAQRVTTQPDEAPEASRRAEAVRRRTVLKPLGLSARGGKVDIVGELGGRVASDAMATAFEGTTPVAFNQPKPRRRPRGPERDVGATVGIAQPRVAKGGGVKTGRKAAEVKLAGRVEPKAPEITDGRGLDRAAIARVIQRNKRRLQMCYERALKRDPNLGGKVTVSFQILSNGRVEQAYVLGDTVGSQVLSQCLIQRVRRLRFPRGDGSPTTVSYPLVFAPAR